MTATYIDNWGFQYSVEWLRPLYFKPLEFDKPLSAVHVYEEDSVPSISDTWSNLLITHFHI